MRFTDDPKIIEGTFSRPTFLICLPSLGMVPIEFVVCFGRMQMPINCQGRTMIVTKTEIGVARNYAAETLLKMNPVPKYLFFIGDDMLPSWDGLMKLWQEMETGKWDILAGLYFIKQDIPIPIIWRDDVPGWLEPYKHFEPGEVVPVDVCGMDFTLIKSEVFKKMDSPWFKTGPGRLDGDEDLYVPGVVEFSVFTEDVFFCRRARKAQLKIGVHTDVRVGHIDIKSGEVF